MTNDKYCTGTQATATGWVFGSQYNCSVRTGLFEHVGGEYKYILLTTLLYYHNTGNHGCPDHLVILIGDHYAELGPGHLGGVEPDVGVNHNDVPGVEGGLQVARA